MTAQWYETFYNKKDILSFTKKQIEEFEKKL